MKMPPCSFSFTKLLVAEYNPRLHRCSVGYLETTFSTQSFQINFNTRRLKQVCTELFLKELEQMKSRIARDEVNVEVDSATGPELGTILSELRSQYEGIVKRNKEQAEQWYRKKVRGEVCSHIRRVLLVRLLIIFLCVTCSWRRCKMRWRRATRPYEEPRGSWWRGSVSCRLWRWSWRVCTNRWTQKQSLCFPCWMQQPGMSLKRKTIKTYNYISLIPTFRAVQTLSITAAKT